MPRLGPQENLTGKRLGCWEVGSYKHNPAGTKYVWDCVCKCGTRRWVRTDQLLDGHSRSCGCLKRELLIDRLTKHGLSSGITYATWQSMMSRCLDPVSPSYHCYGGRGIKICGRWMDVKAFVEDVGERPGPDYFIDRIDNDGDYEPGNVRWADRITQANNRRDNRVITFNGDTGSVSSLARANGFEPHEIFDRLRIGWSVSRSLTQPIVRRKHKQRNVHIPQPKEIQC